MKIDAHQHFWALERGDYGWLTPDLAPLYRDFSPADLSPLLLQSAVKATVLVQAAPTTAETRYMLSLAAEHDWIKGVVGWVDFEAPDAARQIADLASIPKLVGLRPMIQDIPDPDWMLRPSLSPAFDAMAEHKLVFDALTLPKHLENLATLLALHPNLSCVIDHASKPEITAPSARAWADDMARIAAATNARVKLSGLVTEAGPDWTVADLQPFVDHLLAHFGPSRMIWGSDWPVATLAASYGHWVETTSVLLADLSKAKREQVMGLNAIEFYRLEVET